MIKRRRFPRIFFGWWTVLTSGFLTMWGFGYYRYGISALFKPIASELGFSRAVTSVAASIGRLEGGFEAPLTGWVTDKYGPRWPVLIGVFLVGLGLILMNYVNSLWTYYVVWGVILGTGFNAAVGVPMSTAITNWFVKKRGLAMGIIRVFTGFAGVLVLPLVAWLITIQSWQMTCLIGGVVMLLIGLPLAWFCFKRYRPEYYGLLPDGATAEKQVAGTDQMIDSGVEYAAEVEEVEFTLRQAMRTPAYWLLLVAPTCHMLVGPSINIHLIPFLTDRGIDPLRAAGMMAIMVLAGIPSRFFGGLMADRLRRHHLRFLLGGAYLLEAVGIAIFLLNPESTFLIYVWFIVYGTGMGAANTLGTPVKARYFGRKAFGSISGFSSLFMMPIVIVAPIYAGWVYDTTGSYITVFTLFAVLLAFATVLMSLASPPKPPAQITDVRKIV
ncbi:MFS transporter [Chloroflexota bacterium]